MKVWRIQNTTQKPNTISVPEGPVSETARYSGVANTEVLMEGVNTGTDGPNAAVARHGNFLQWGFTAPPSKMTDPGRKFFLNCICYIAKFDGKGP
jgi:hypothetical protein